jgi:predicted NBD/HSP70 family sugar kinase
MVLDGRLYRGDGGTAGEIGHVQVDATGVLCRCGSRGCLETVVSVPRLIAALAPVTAPDLTPDDLGRHVAEGHPGAVRVVTDAGRTVGRVVAALVTVVNPGLVVLGGSVPPVNELLARCIRSAVDQWATPAAAARVAVRASSRGDRGEIEGALALASELARRAHRARLGDGPAPGSAPGPLSP